MSRSFRARRPHWPNGQAPNSSEPSSNLQRSPHFQTPQPSDVSDVSMMDWQPTTPVTCSPEYNPYPEGYMPGGWPITSPQDLSQILGPRPPPSETLESVKRICLGIDTTTQSAVRRVANIGRAWISASISGAGAIVGRPAYFVVRQYQREHPRESRRPVHQVTVSPWKKIVAKENRKSRGREQNSSSLTSGNTFEISGIPVPFQKEQRDNQVDSDYLPCASSANTLSPANNINGSENTSMYQEKSDRHTMQNKLPHITSTENTATGIPFPFVVPTTRKKQNSDFKPRISSFAKNNSSLGRNRASAPQPSTPVTSSDQQQTPTLHSVDTSPPRPLSNRMASTHAKAGIALSSIQSVINHEESELGSPDNIDLLTPPPIRFRQIGSVQKFSSPTSVKAPSDVKSASKSPDKSEISSTYDLPPDTYSQLETQKSSPVPEASIMQTVSDISSAYGIPPDSYSLILAQQNSADILNADTPTRSLGNAMKSFSPMLKKSFNYLSRRSSTPASEQASHPETITESPQQIGPVMAESGQNTPLKNSTPRQASSKKSVRFADQNADKSTTHITEENRASPAQKSPSVPDQAFTEASDIEVSKENSAELKPSNAKKPTPPVDTPVINFLTEDSTSDGQPQAKTTEQKFAELSLSEDIVEDQPTPKATKHSSEKGQRLTRAEIKRLEAQQELLKYEIVPLSAEWEVKVKEALKNGHKNGRKELKPSDLTRVVPVAPGRGTDNWLNDEVINDYLSLVVAHGKTNDREMQSPSHHAFSSFFYTNLSQKGYQGVQRWATRAKIGGKSLLHTELVFIPINSGMHWTLCVVSGTKRTITYYNSLRGSGKTQVETVLEWVKGELGKSFDETEWSLNPSGESPQQQNMDDCGVFTITSARQIMLGFTPMSYRPDQIMMQRKRIVAELVNGKLIKSAQ